MANRKGLRAEAAASRFIARKETGPWSEQEQQALEQWLEESTLHRVAYYRLNAAWQEAGRLKVLPAQDHRAQLAILPARKPRPRGFRLSFAAAAGVVLALAAVLGLLYASVFSVERHRTGVGGLEAVQMADGSRVMLNTDSEIKIQMGTHERRIVLSRGEAFFDVAKDPSRPFVVSVGERRVVAVGTQFAVRRDNGALRVSVTEGVVRMEQEAAKSVLLPAGTLARVEAGEVRVREQPVARIEQDLTWRSGVLTFNRTPLAQAVEEINRYNTRQIVIRDPGAAAIQVGGTFVATKLDSFLSLLESGFPLRVTQEGSRIAIDSK